MRVVVIENGGESDSMSLEELRDHLDLGMVHPGQSCYIEGSEGDYVVGELLTGQVFHEMEEAPDTDWVDGKPRALRLEREEDEEDREDRVGEDYDVEEDEGPEDVMEEEAPVWLGRPSLLSFPRHVLVTFLIAGAAAAAWKLEWSGWLAAAFAGITCLSASLLLARRAALRYAVFPSYLGLRRGLFFRRRLLLPRVAVVSFEREAGWGALLGGADLVVIYRRGGTFRKAVMRGVRGGRKAVRLWSAGSEAPEW